MTYQIHPATLTDVPDIQQLNKKLFEHEIASGFDANIDANWSLSEEGKKEISARVSSPESCGFIAKDGDTTIGYLIGRIVEEETGRAESKFAELEHMLIDESYRGQGIGEQLVNNFKAWAKSKGLKLIKVNVSFKNAQAIKFYNKVGLEALDVTLVGNL
ncbi:MAG: hypothetical protein UT32_C0019G0003 [Parcubacteria group bacterium GW2011_GWC2_39_14]|nr:MAG: hypothetical protein UT32_C0019G0003 [Parcubacteria group bacterium GW2011_GWC2_39_14]KKR54536.1 MAG: hypothetical protein UT91_C0013G0003 [Parcubacteria group bacterium GW2011_GWA2_40_23]